MSPRTVFVDVDDTLVRFIGADYARQSAVELGIEDGFAGFLAQPDAYIDDQAVSDWRYCRHVLPAHAADAADPV